MQWQCKGQPNNKIQEERIKRLVEGNNKKPKMGKISRGKTEERLKAGLFVYLFNSLVPLPSLLPLAFLVVTGGKRTENNASREK